MHRRGKGPRLEELELSFSSHGGSPIVLGPLSQSFHAAIALKAGCEALTYCRCWNSRAAGW